MKKAYVQIKDEYGNYVLVEKEKVDQTKLYIKTSKKSPDTFHHEAGKGSKRR